MCKYTNFGAFIQYLAECKVTSQVPVTTTGRKINITQLIAEKWTPVHKTFTIHWHYINNTFTKIDFTLTRHSQKLIIRSVEQ